MKVENVMTKDVGTCAPNQSLNDAAQIMWERDCGIVPVVQGDGERRLLGVITDRDICIAAYTKGLALRQISIGEVMSKQIAACRGAEDLATAEHTMQQAQVHRLPVTDDAGRLIGMLALADIARAMARSRDKASEGELGETVAAIRRPRSLEERHAH